MFNSKLTEFSNIINEIKATRNPKKEYEYEYDYTGEDRVFRYNLNSDLKLRVSIIQHSAGRWSVDTDFVVYNCRAKNVSSYFRWFNTCLETGQYNTGYGKELEYGSTFRRKKFKNARIRNQYTCK